MEGKSGIRAMFMNNVKGIASLVVKSGTLGHLEIRDCVIAS